MNSPLPNKIAVDLGTTTLAGQLLGDTGEVLAEAQVPNPQAEFGADILLRLQWAHDHGGVRLQTLVVDGVRALIAELLGKACCAPESVGAIAVAGNPGMSCLLRNLPVDSLLFPPHKPPYKELSQISVDEVDLGLPQAWDLFPLVSGFVGGDLVAAILGVEEPGPGSCSVVQCSGESDSPHAGTAPEVVPGTLLIDIGTNAELALWDGCRWWVTSAAAGPAFEGGNIGTGMIMADGAVTDVQLDGDRLQLVVVGGGPPSGLCGSGLAALVAVARQGGLIDSTGRIASPDDIDTNLNRYLVNRNGSWAICFHRSASGELMLTQEDLRNFQVAKGAVLAGTRILLERGGFDPRDLQQVFVTGALGTALPVEILKRVALLPEPMLDKTSFVANGVLAGLQTYLTAKDGAQRLATLMKQIQPFPLSGTPAFERLFLASLEF